MLEILKEMGLTEQEAKRLIRTFPEIDQVPSEFIFRMREGNGIEMALFEADGGAWRMKTIERIKAWLEKEIKENNLKNITILA